MTKIFLKLLKRLTFNKINDPDLGQAMKNGKSPGIYSISGDFLKAFWIKPKYFIRNAKNACYRKGKLLYSMRQSVIASLSKGNKDRQF